MRGVQRVAFVSAPVIEGGEGVSQAAVAADGAGPALGAVQHICIAEAPHKHHTCTTPSASRN